MKYKVIKRANPQDRSKEKWYASPMNEGKVSKAELTKEIVNASSLSRGDVSNVIENLLEAIPKYLLMGKSVSLGELGTLRLSFSSEGADQADQVKATMISNTKVVFTPGVELKSALEKIKFEKGE